MNLMTVIRPRYCSTYVQSMPSKKPRHSRHKAVSHTIQCLMGVCASSEHGSSALSTAVLKSKPDKYIKKHCHAYFDLIMTKTSADDSDFPSYSNYCIRWEWEPWLLLTLKNTGFDIWSALDALQSTIIPAEIPKSERFCRVFNQNPFCRMMVKFYYPSKEFDDMPSHIYEEFTFNKQGEITFVEVWSYPERSLRNGGGKGYLVENLSDPVIASDCFDNKLHESDKKVFWPKMDMARLSTRIPGLGSESSKPLVLTGKAFVGDTLHPEMIRAIRNSKDEHLQLFATRYSAPFAKQLYDERNLAAKDPVRNAYLKEMDPSLMTRFSRLSEKNQAWINSTNYFESLFE